MTFIQWKKEIDALANAEYGSGFCESVLISEGNWMDGMTPIQGLSCEIAGLESL